MTQMDYSVSAGGHLFEIVPTGFGSFAMKIDGDVCSYYADARDAVADCSHRHVSHVVWPQGPAVYSKQLHFPSRLEGWSKSPSRGVLFE